MSTVEVLAPLRLETRFVPPEERRDGSAQWMLRLRVYPDEFSIRRSPAPPTSDELDRLREAVDSMLAAPALPESDAFASFASAVGAGRALRLWRMHVVSDGAGGLTVDRTGEVGEAPLAVHGPAGLPDRLEVWLIRADGTRQLGATLLLDVASIGSDLDLAKFDHEPTLAAGTLPRTWWLSYARALEVGLAADLDIGVTPPVLDALVVVGVGDTDAADLIDAHNATGRLAVLAPGTPTNTVAGEPTTDFGDHAETIYPLLRVDAATQMSTDILLKGLTGRVPQDALPMLGGDLDYYAPGSLAVQGFWPVLWGRVLRDVTGAGATELELARWAIRRLAVEGPRPAFRVGEQPYGLLPTSSFASWIDDAGDPEAAVEQRIRSWALPWRARAASAARVAHTRTAGQDIGGFLDVLGLHAPSRHWQVRAIADRYVIQALRALFGMPPLDTTWDDTTAQALRGAPAPLAPVARAPGLGPIPGPPRDQVEEVDTLRSLPSMEPDALLSSRQLPLGLVGHLMRESLIDARALVGEAIARVQAATPVSLAQNLTWADETAYRSLVYKGTNAAVAALRGGPDANGRIVAERFKDVQDALQVIADLWADWSKPLFRATLAALDTAAFRVDPWLIGIADRRLQQMTASGAPFKLGAYGWVDAPAPYAALPGGPLAPGPTAAGLLHAPSHAQALTAALLRDAAVRYPAASRWDLTIDSARVRAAAALAERVRLGVHPYEALGLEVEALAGDWDTVRVLRRKLPLATDQQERRVCDGQKVLRAAREGTLAATLAPDLAPAVAAYLTARLAPLDHVLDTYADLLVADGVYALVTGRGDLANAAMEAAAGLGAPPELRAIRTPRQAKSVRIGAWMLLPPGITDNGADADPLVVADPAFAAAADRELGAGALRPVDEAGRARCARFATMVGGAEDDVALPRLAGGEYEGLGATAEGDLHTAIGSDLRLRFDRLVALAGAARAALIGLDPDAAGANAEVSAAAVRWSFDLGTVSAADPAMAAPTTKERRDALAAALADRLGSASAVPAGPMPLPPPDALVTTLRRAIRTLAGRSDLPVLPTVPRVLLPVLRINANADRVWLEIVAAVRPRLAALEARQLSAPVPWRAAVAAPDSSSDPWHSSGPIVVAYGPGVGGNGGRVAIAALDGWNDSIPSRRHATVAAFGFNAPKSRAPQAVLVAVPPDRSTRLDTTGLVDVVLETRELAHARSPRQIPEPTLPHPTSTAFVSTTGSRNFLEGWPP
jgi:hypothetical protein